MKYTKIAVDTFEKLQLNAGLLVDDFDPATGEIGNIIGATTGGISFTASPEYSDYGEDIDNVPANMMELKKLTSIGAEASGTFVTVDPESARFLVGGADIDPLDESHIIPRKDINVGDFKEVWIVGDYSDVNDGDSAGFIAIHMMNTLSTGGFQLQTNDDGKGNFAFTLTGHYSMNAQDVVPFEIYLKQGEGGDTDEGIVLEVNKITVVLDDSPKIKFYNYTEFTGITVASDNEGLTDNLYYEDDEIGFNTPNDTPSSTSAKITVTAYKGAKQYTTTIKVELYVEGA